MKESIQKNIQKAGYPAFFNPSLFLIIYLFYISESDRIDPTIPNFN